MNYLKSFCLIVIVSLLGKMLAHSIAHTNLVMLYILAVVITALRWGKGPSLMSAFLSVLFFDFFFVPPHFSMTVADTQYLIAFATLFVVATVISSLTLRAKEQAKAAQIREAQTLALYNLSRELIDVDATETLFIKAVQHLTDTFDADAAIFIKDKNNNLIIKAKSENFHLNEDNQSSELILLKTTKEAFGLIDMRFKTAARLSVEQNRFLQAFADQIAIAIERFELAKQANEAGLLREADKLHTAFLNSVSHDLRTPLASISGSLSSIKQNTKLDKKSQRELIETAHKESVRLNQLVGDLLDMARVEGGALHIKKKNVDVKDLIGAALKQMGKNLQGFTVKVSVPDFLPEILVDFTLMIKVLTNIIDNAIKYSLEKKEITIEAIESDNNLEITISDSGIGVPESDMKHIFDKFYRVRHKRKFEGTGLGLSVCKGIVDAHGGTIWAENRKTGGMDIKIKMPVTNINDKK